MPTSSNKLRARLLRSAIPAVLLGSVAMAGTAHAQVETITVTAQKTAQDIQRVPIAVTAFTAASLQARGITDVANLSNSTPNVTFDAGVPFGGSGTVLAAYIRGIGQNDFAFNQDPGVGVYLDGVYLARSVGANTDLLDIERIEILKGPQGTLFGRNTIGGAISIVTRDPGDEFSYKLDVTGGTYNRLDVRGTADLPITDRLSTSVSFSTKHRDGYLDRIPFPTSGPLFDAAAAAAGLYTPAGAFAPFHLGAGDCVGVVACTTIVDPTRAAIQAGYDSHDEEGGENQWNVRGKAVWDMSDALKFTVAADYTHVDSQGQAMKPLHIDPNYIPPGAPGPSTTLGSVYNTCIADPAAFLAFLATIPGVPRFPIICGPRGTPGSVFAPDGAAFALQAGGTLLGVNYDGDPTNNRLAYGPWFETADRDKSYSTGPSFDRLKQYGISGTIDWDVNDAHIKAITAYRALHWTVGMDGDGSPLNIHELSFDMAQHEFSQELQLTGRAFDDRLSYVFGAYYFYEAGHLHDFVTFPGLSLMVDGNNLLSTTAWAGYFHLNYLVADNFSITVGGRYTDESKDFEGFQSDPNALIYKIVPATIDIGPPVGVIPLNCWSTVGDPITDACRIALGFPDPSDPLRFFPPGTNSQGYTNFSPRFGIEYQASDDMMLYASYSEGFKSGSWTTRLSNPLPVAPTFGPEKAKSYEVGLKSEFMDNRVRLNLAGFYTKYDGIQLNFQVGVSPTLQNAGDAIIWGAEAELSAFLSDNFVVNAAVGFADAEYDSVTPGAGSNGVLITTATALPKTPEWKVNISPQYTHEMGDSGDLVLNLDYTYTSKLFNDTQNTAELARPATSVLNGSVTFKAPGGNWDFVVGGTNLTDERYVLTGVNQGGIQLIYGSYNRPREWFATVRIRS